MKQIGQFHSKIAGSTFNNSQEILRAMKEEEVLNCQREKDNAFDKNAVAIYNEKKEKLGFFPKETAVGLAKQIDAGCTVTISVSEITGRDKSFVGCNILVTVFSDKEDDNIDDLPPEMQTDIY